MDPPKGPRRAAANTRGRFGGGPRALRMPSRCEARPGTVGWARHWGPGPPDETGVWRGCGGIFWFVCGTHKQSKNRVNLKTRTSRRDRSTEGWWRCVAAPPRIRSDGGASGGRVGPLSGDVGAEPAGHGDAKTSQHGVAAAPRWSRRRRRWGRRSQSEGRHGRWQTCWGGPAPAVVDLRPPNIGTWSLRRGVIPMGVPGSRLRGLLRLDHRPRPSLGVCMCSSRPEGYGGDLGGQKGAPGPFDRPLPTVSAAPWQAIAPPHTRDALCATRCSPAVLWPAASTRWLAAPPTSSPTSPPAGSRAARRSRRRNRRCRRERPWRRRQRQSCLRRRHRGVGGRQERCKRVGWHIVQCQRCTSGTLQLHLAARGHGHASMIAASSALRTLVASGGALAVV